MFAWFFHTKSFREMVGKEGGTTEGVDAEFAQLAMHNFGAGDLLEIRPDQSSDTVMLPFTAATVPVVDVAGGRLVIDPPPGLLDPDAAD